MGLVLQDLLAPGLVKVWGNDLKGLVAVKGRIQLQRCIWQPNAGKLQRLLPAA